MWWLKTDAGGEQETRHCGLNTNMVSQFSMEDILRTWFLRITKQHIQYYYANYILCSFVKIIILIIIKLDIFGQCLKIVFVWKISIHSKLMLH